MSNNAFRLVDNFSNAGEQVFSNHLLLALISNDLSTQDLLRASVVNWNWYRKFRDILNKRSKTREVSIQIGSVASRCRALKKLNDSLPKFFEEIYFNGIYQKYKRVKPRYGTSDSPCQDCLNNKNDDSAHVTPDDGSKVEDLDKMYGNILAKIKFKYIRFEASLEVTCPFAQFMKRVIRDNADKVVEMKFKDSVGISEYRESCEFFLDHANQKDDGIPTFPNLQVLGIRRFGLRQPLIAPFLQALQDVFYSPVIESIMPTLKFFPLRTVTRFVLRREALRSKVDLDLFQSFKLKAQNLKIGSEEDPMTTADVIESEEHRLNVFKLGTICSASLTLMWCPISYFLAFTTMGISESLLLNNINKNNIFFKLKKLKLYGQMNTVILDWILSADGTTNAFPQLDKLYLNCSEGPGCTNEFKGELSTRCIFPRVKFLHLNVKGTVSDLTVRVLKAFKQLRHLSLGFDLNPLESFGCIEMGISDWERLGEVSLLLDAVKCVNGNEYYPNPNCNNIAEGGTQHICAVELGDASPVSNFLACVLKQKGIRKLNFGSICSTNKGGVGSSYLDCHPEILKRFLTQRNVAWMRDMNPELKLHLDILLPSTPMHEYTDHPECFNDLKNCIKIVKFDIVESKSETKVLRSWDLTFLKMDDGNGIE